MKNLASILQTYGHAPTHTEIPPQASWKIKGQNTRTRDSLLLAFLLREKTIEKAGFKAEGSAVLQASCSLLCESFTQQTLPHCENIARETLLLIQGKLPPHLENQGARACLALLSKYPARIACATLPWRAFLKDLPSIS